MILAIIIFIFILTALVMVHELGHFWVARKNKIKVEEFGLGLPPRIWGKKYKGTIYSINWLPFGGFVRLLGEDSEGADLKKKGSFYLAPAPVRAAVVVAGVLVNYFVAVVLLYAVLLGSDFKFTVPQIIDHEFRFATNTTQVVLAEFSADSPLRSLGVEQGSVVNRINGELVTGSMDFSEQIKKSGDKIVLELNKQDGIEQSVTVVPLEKDGKKILGVYLAEQTVISYDGFWQKLFSGFSQSINLGEYSVKVMVSLVGSAFATGNFAPVSQGVAGPVGIAQYTKIAMDFGWIASLQLVALLSLNLAMVNILPIPALDGGRFFFIVIEIITRKRVGAKFERIVHTVGFAALIALTFVVTANDILKLL